MFGMVARATNPVIAKCLLALTTGALLSVASAPANRAYAYTFKTIYSFCAKTNCADGGVPFGPVTIGPSGELYGMTNIGGKYLDSGLIYELVHNSSTGKWKLQVLHDFCSQNKCADGARPYLGGLILDAAGDLYGTALQGGLTKQGLINNGVAFELAPNADRSKWTLKVLHAFCSDGGAACTDGTEPQTGLTYLGASTGAPYDGASPLYGAVGNVVYELRPGAGGGWGEKVLYQFCSEGGEACTDGSGPKGSLFIDPTGNLYGSTTGGGENNFNGTVFELSPNLKRTEWTERVLYSFCALSNCADGKIPDSTVTMDASGRILGTTTEGGLPVGQGSTGGVVYSLSPAVPQWAESVLYDFCTLPACTDGVSSLAGVIEDNAGVIYGTTLYTGRVNGPGGTVFKLSKTTLQILHSFCSKGGSGCTDGSEPFAGVVMDASGNLFGTTSGGGAHGFGTIFEVTP